MQKTNSERSSTERRFRSKLQREQQETQQLQAREERKAKQMKKMSELVLELILQVQLLEMAGSGSRPELLYLPLTDLPEPTVSLERTTKVVVSSDLRSQEPRKRPNRQTALVETTKVELAILASVVDLLAESQEKLMQPHQTQVSLEPASRRKMPQ